MSYDQTYLDGTSCDVVVVPCDAEGNMGDFERIGSALDRRSAVLLVSEIGNPAAPEREGYDCGHLASAEEPDAFGAAVFI